MSKKRWPELSPGSVIADPGNSAKDYVNCRDAGPKPEFHDEGCVHCFFCWLFCPENAIIVHNNRVTEINYDFCNGCGLCVAECPVNKDPLPLTLPTEKKDKQG